MRVENFPKGMEAQDDDANPLTTDEIKTLIGQAEGQDVINRITELDEETMQRKSEKQDSSS